MDHFTRLRCDAPSSMSPNLNLIDPQSGMPIREAKLIHLTIIIRTMMTITTVTQSCLKVASVVGTLTMTALIIVLSSRLAGTPPKPKLQALNP